VVTIILLLCPPVRFVVKALAQLGAVLLGLAAQLLLPGLEKTRVFLKNPAQWVFLVFFGFLMFFYIFAQKRESLGFFQFQEYF
jgi:hypothetical protein